MDRNGPVPEYAPQLGNCWWWTAYIDKLTGYGRVAKGGREGAQWAHIIAWELTHGPVPVGLKLDHLCRVHRCVNPYHLEVVTHGENIRRGYEAKRRRRAE